MAKVICKLPNASELINGVKFVSHKLGMISEEIADDVAAEFAKIRGYVLADRKGKPVEAEPGNAGGNAPPAGAETGASTPATGVQTDAPAPAAAGEAAKAE